MKYLSLLLLCMASGALAADLSGQLPEDQAKFGELVSSLIKPGHSLNQAQKLLVSGGFECKRLNESASPSVWCQRLTGNSLSSVKRRYQVILRHKEEKIVSVSANTGLVGL